MKIKKMFDEYAKKFGTVVWKDIELALTQDAYPDGPYGDWYFRSVAMDKAGNLWDVFWYPKPDANEWDDYASQVEDWDKPDFAEMIVRGYYLD
jgi:hypothetical protein